MDLELWYLVLIPVLFAAGWWARGLDAREREANSRQLPEAYSRGVAMLMSDKPERAVDPFTEVCRLDPELIELHHVLGTLFRRRGEFERAIRLHNHLVNREDIADEDRVRALKALGDDYMDAGIFDRAERTYQRLLDNPAEHITALQSLLKIYCTEHEWVSAIDTARQLEVQGGFDKKNEIAHYWCELAEGALRRKNVELAGESVRNALAVCPESVRANILAGTVALAGGDADGAAASWQSVMERTPAYLPLVIGKLADVMHRSGDTEGARALLHKALADNSSIDVMEEAVTRIAQWEGTEPACEAVTQVLAGHPSISAFSALISLREKENPADEQTKLLATLLQRHARRLGRYQCKKCGFLASGFSWHCLGCGEWDSFPPRRLEDGK